MEKQKKIDQSAASGRKLPLFLKRNGLFFSILFLVWMCIMFFANISHQYSSSPLPNELQSLQQQQYGSVQQNQQPH